MPEYVYVEREPDPIGGHQVFGLVLSILWVFGIGSLVGVIIGGGELRHTRGGAFVIALLSLIFGIMGLLATGLMVLAANA